MAPAEPRRASGRSLRYLASPIAALPRASCGTVCQWPGVGRLPLCRAGPCDVEDIRESALTECVTATDCHLRHGVACCQSCSTIDRVAVRSDLNEIQAFCGGFSLPCPLYPVQPPSGVSADCQGGRCVVGRPPSCMLGQDRTYNQDPTMNSLSGMCQPDGTCLCNRGLLLDPMLGTCFAVVPP